ncbi:MAG: CvpA family protein [Candidatus Woykebacteria bacterium]
MFNFIDLIVVVLIIYLIWQGWRTGFIGGILNLLTTAVSLVAATIFYPFIGDLLNNQFAWGPNLAHVVAFFMILIVLEVVLSFTANRHYGLFAPVFKKVEGFLLVDKILGVIPSLLVGLFLVSLFLLLPLMLPVSANLKNPIEESWWGGNVLPLGLKYQPTLEKYLNRLPYQNLVYLITPEPSSQETVEINIPKKIEFKEDPDSEKEMLLLVNRERADKGLRQLSTDPALRNVSRAHCLDMFKRSYFSHYTPEGKSPFDRMQAAGIKYQVAGENLAYASSVQTAHQGLMNSKGHRENILRPEFGKLGVGVIDGGLAGKMFCQEFTN